MIVSVCSSWFSPCVVDSWFVKLLHRLNLRECLRAVQDLLSRLVDADGVVPALHDRNGIGLPGIAAEADRVGAVVVRLGRRVVEAVPAEVIFLEIPVSVVNGDGPKGIDRHVLNRHGVGCLAVILVDATHLVVSGGAWQTPRWA
jgi:hypothetical protein